MKISAIQMVSGADVQSNLEQAAKLLAQAAQAGAELAILPEYFCLLGQRDSDKLLIQETFGQGPIQNFLSAAAKDLGLWIVGGTLPLSTSGQTPDRVFNSALAFSPEGRCVARYDKIHLFRFDNGRERYDESRVLQPGTTPALFELPARDGHVWRVGLSVCYDLRFPELYRRYAEQGADVLLVPSAFTYATGEPHWEVLLRARAIENLAYVAAPAQGGQHDNGRRTWGHTLVADPWGRLIGVHEEGPGLVTVELAADKLQSCRSQLPALTHRTL